MFPQVLLKNRKYRLFEGLPHGNLTCAFSMRKHGNMSLVYGDTKHALNNRKAFLRELDINYEDLVCARQIHGNNIKYVKEQDRGKGALSYDSAIADTDGLITDKRNLPLAVFTADCLPIFLYEPRTPSIALVHAGWRSSKENISARAIELMQEEFNIKIKDLYVGFGPGIRGCCYEVGRDFGNFFSDELRQRAGHYYLDLVKINKKQLLRLGVRDINISDVKICTSCQNEDLFSYRKEGSSCGRMMSVAMLD